MTNRTKLLAVVSFLIFAFGNQIFAQNTKEILWSTDWSPNGDFIAIGGNVDSLKIYKENYCFMKFFHVNRINITSLHTRAFDKLSKW